VRCRREGGREEGRERSRRKSVVVACVCGPLGFRENDEVIYGVDRWIKTMTINGSEVIRRTWKTGKRREKA